MAREMQPGHRGLSIAKRPQALGLGLPICQVDDPEPSASCDLQGQTLCCAQAQGRQNWVQTPTLPILLL